MLARIDPLVAPFAWRTRAGGFSGLMRLIVEQQVSTASAAAIWARLEAGLGEVTPAAILAREAQALKGLGLSSPKVRYALAIAAAHDRGEIDLEGLAALDDETAIIALTRLVGVGRWTAEVYLMFSEGRLDVFPAGDLALQEALRWAERCDVRPGEKALYARAEAWRPYRAVAAHLLWDYYLAVRAKTLPGEGSAAKRVAPVLEAQAR